MPIPAFAQVNHAAASQDEVVAAQTGYKIRVLGYMIVAAGAVTVKFQSANTDLTPAMSMITGVPLPGGWGGFGLFETAAGEALNITLGGAVQVSGHVTYTLIPA